MSIEEILKNSKVIAVIGCSRNPEKDAHKVPKYLKESGYKIIPVNPFAEEILGERVYKDITEIEEKIDVVDIFRPSEEVSGIMEKILKMPNKPKVIWMQKGIINEQAAELARENGIEVVMDKCVMIEHKRIKRNNP